MNNNNYRVGDVILFSTTRIAGKYIPDEEEASEGIVVKVYYDGSVCIIDPYNENEEYHIIKAEQIVCKEYQSSPLAMWLIELLEKVMPIEYWTLASLIIGCILGGILK